MPFTIALNFDYNINVSLQVGDQVYYTTTSQLGGFDQNPNIVQQHIGEVQDIISPGPTALVQVDVYSPYTLAPPYVPPSDVYISFSKNRIVNNNDLLGYYASVKFINNSPDEAELWAVGVGIAENSK